MNRLTVAKQPSIKANINSVGNEDSNEIGANNDESNAQEGSSDPQGQ